MDSLAELDIRSERSADAAAIQRIHQAAFNTPGEAHLVALLRERGKLLVSLVAELDQQVVGHVAFSPVLFDSTPTEQSGAGLAPVAVLPIYQRRGVGSRLIQAGLAACRQAAISFVVVLGEPAYYQRFGFRPASLRGIRNEYGVGEPFMVLELQANALPPAGGLIKYAPEFAECFP
jgi:putative acetyltransferase